jgi:ATP/maltotriose-dependent transcriptional regulator MalT
VAAFVAEGARGGRLGVLLRFVRTRLPTSAATLDEQYLTVAEANVGSVAEDPSDAKLAVLRLPRHWPLRGEIGSRLYISLNTVKTHTRELYRELGATSRADAIAREEALGLLERTESPG